MNWNNGMLISKINNSLSFKKTQDQGLESNELYRLDDETLYDIASFEHKSRIRKITNNSVKTIFMALPVADALVSGFAHSGPLSSKLSKSGSVLGKWAGVFATAGAVFGIKHMINSKSKKLDNFDKNNRMLGFAVDFGALYGALAVFSNLGKISKSYAVEKFPKFFDSVKKHLMHPTKEILNASVINKKIVKPFENFMAKHPHYNATTKAAAVILAPLIGVAAVMRLSKEINHSCETVDENFLFLKAFNNMLPEKNYADSNENIENNQ